MAFYSILVLSFILAGHTCHGKLSFIAVGDWGDDQPSGMVNQAVVAGAMDAWCASHVCEFIISTGDNFYPQGVTSVNDTRFDSSWKNVYTGPNIVNKYWYMSVGNHDHDDPNPGDGRERFQVEHSAIEPRWILPALYYDFVFNDGSVTVHFIVVDSQSLKDDKNDAAGQMYWLEDTLARSVARWKVVFLHHSPYSAGAEGPTDNTIEADVVPLCEKYFVDVVLTGHDHDLQHITKMVNPDIDYVVSGSGGRPLDTQDNSNTNDLNSLGFQIDYFGYVYGFVYFEFTANIMDVSYVDTEGYIVYGFRRVK